MSCKVKHESALLNSRDFLITQGAIDKQSNIKSQDKFNEANTQMSEDALNAYGVEGALWLEKSGRAVPNHSTLKSIDDKRKELGLYDKKEAGTVMNIPEEYIDEPLDSEVIGYEDTTYSAKDFDAQRELIKEGNKDAELLSLETFDENFPELSYATDFEKQMIIDSIKEGDISINCKI